MKLTQLARKTLEEHFKQKKFEPDQETKEKFKTKQACFVTLTEKGKLRGCIGSLQAHQELWKDVQDNAINAGFHDFRFMPLTNEELDKIKIEVSILSVPEELEFKDEKELLNKINKNMGIILQQGMGSATFLPQVWEQLPDKKQFLENLSLKAGLEKDAWKTADIYFYNVEKIEEE